MAAARPDTWMPLYIGDYLADTAHLDRALHGSYLLLIFACWKAGGELPDVDRLLCAIAKTTAREWKVERPVLAPFFIIEDGVWRHKRVTKELARSTEITQERSKAGTLGAAKRWQSHKQSDGKAIANGMATQSQIDAPSQSQEERTDRAAPSGRTPDEKPCPIAAREDGPVGADAHDDKLEFPSFLKRVTS